MKSTSIVALTIGVRMFSTWGVAEAAEPSLGSSFKEWCQKKASLPTEAAKTVEVLLAEAGTSDCEGAAEDLLSRTRLFLENDQITDVSPLSGLTNLTELYLNFSPITDVSPLAELTNLKKLGLYYNQITDVSPLARLTNLWVLYLSYNQITDISPLAGLTNLRLLNLTGNPITEPTCPVFPPTVCDFEKSPWVP